MTTSIEDTKYETTGYKEWMVEFTTKHEHFYDEL